MAQNISSQAQKAREDARRDNGEFGTYAAGESGATLNDAGPADSEDRTPEWLGGHHEPGRDITDIAKDVRGDIKRAQDDGWLREDLSYSVRTERFSQGRAMRVQVRGMTDDERLGYARDPIDPSRFNPDGTHSAEAEETRERLSMIVDQYNRDASGEPVESFDADFYHSVEFETEEDTLADQRQRDTDRMAHKMKATGTPPGEILPDDISAEIDQMHRGHNEARQELANRKARRQAGWRSQWAAEQAGEGSAEHTSERLREKVLDAELPHGWSARPKTGTFDEGTGEFEAATIYASLDRPDDDTLMDAPRFQQIDIAGPGRESGKSGMNTIYSRVGIEASPNPDEGEERVILRAYTERGSERSYTGDRIGSDVDDADRAVSDMVWYLDKRRSLGHL